MPKVYLLEKFAATLGGERLTVAVTRRGQNESFHVSSEPQHGRGPVQRIS
jgi:hypothetical protein